MRFTLILCIGDFVGDGQRESLVVGVCANPVTHAFILAISIAPHQVLYYLEALPTQHRYCAGVSRRSATGKVPKRGG